MFVTGYGKNDRVVHLLELCYNLIVARGKIVLGEVFMVNSIQLEGLTYVRSLTQPTTSSKIDNEDFDSVLKDKINTSDNKEESDKVAYTNPEDLVCVDSPSSLEKYFQEAADTYGVPIALIKAVAKAESNFNTQSISSAGAQGVMQLMPETARGLGVKDPFDARENILGGTKYLAKMLTKYNGSVKLSLAAYNAGSGNVAKYGGVPPFKETQNYIQKIFGYLGMDTTKSTSQSETDKKSETTSQNAQSSNLSSEDIQKLADAILSGISSEKSKTSARDLYSELYGSSNGSSVLSNYSNIASKLLNS